MKNTLPDDIEQLKRFLAEQEALNRALLAKLEEREREIDRLSILRRTLATSAVF